MLKKIQNNFNQNWKKLSFIGIYPQNKWIETEKEFKLRNWINYTSSEIDHILNSKIY